MIEGLMISKFYTKLSDDKDARVVFREIFY